MQAPQAGHGFRVDQLEDALLAVRPLDVARAVVPVLQQLQQELPQVRRRSWKKDGSALIRCLIVTDPGQYSLRIFTGLKMNKDFSKIQIIVLTNQTLSKVL